MTLGRKITLALTLTLALLAGLFFLRLGDHQGSAREDRQPRSPVPHQDHAPNSRNLTQQQPLRTDSHTPEPARIHIKARLLEGSLVEATLRVGSISAEDWIEINAEGTRRKPSDLLNFGDPRPIAVTPDGQGNGLLDLQALAPAAAYRIEALRPADGAWYAHDFIPEQGKVPTADRLDDLGDIPPTLPTGIELHFINAPPGVEDFEVTLQRQPSQETVKDASEALRLVERLRPDILDAPARGGCPPRARIGSAAPRPPAARPQYPGPLSHPDRCGRQLLGLPPSPPASAARDRQPRRHLPGCTARRRLAERSPAPWQHGAAPWRRNHRARGRTPYPPPGHRRRRQLRLRRPPPPEPPAASTCKCLAAVPRAPSAGKNTGSTIHPLPTPRPAEIASSGESPPTAGSSSSSQPPTRRRSNA
jgi:hypothetical protein